MVSGEECPECPKAPNTARQTPYVSVDRTIEVKTLPHVSPICHTPLFLDITEISF